LSMGGKYKAQNHQTKNEFNDFYATNMIKYMEHRDFMNDYYDNSASFISSKIKQIDSNNINRSSPRTYENFDSVKVLLNQNKPSENSYTNRLDKIQDKDLDRKFTGAQYFKQSTLPNAPPEAFLFNPGVRDQTDSGKFGLFPCSGGIKGPAEYYKPGSKVVVKWQILNPSEDSQCIIKMAQKNDQNADSYQTLNPLGREVDKYTGYFACGENTKEPEAVVVQIPTDADCSICTLQLTYKSADYGELYQCADLSTQRIEGSDDCTDECLNGGI